METVNIKIPNNFLYIPEVEDFVKAVFANNPLRLAHILKVATLSRCTARNLNLAGSNILVDENLCYSAALLHDIGYWTEINRLNFHPLDGANFLKEAGFPQLAELIVSHSNSPEMAELLGLEKIELSEKLEASIITFWDIRVKQGGELVTYEERLADILNRYGENSIVAQASLQADFRLKKLSSMVQSLESYGDLDQLITLYKSTFGIIFSEIVALNPHASSRRLWRLSSENNSCILAVHNSVEENRAFYKLSEHFTSKGLSVPQVYKISPSGKEYFLQDLGRETLFDYLKRNGIVSSYPLYKQALSDLLKFQMVCREGFPLDVCYDHKFFNQEAILSDLEYLRSSFFDLLGKSYNKKLLMQEFFELSNYLLKAGSDTLIYRDFQSRNIMHLDGRLIYIDFQRTCFGPLQYDVATLLFQSQANLSKGHRKDLLDYYLDLLECNYQRSKNEFLNYYYEFVLVRLCEVLGTYGKFGLGQRKEYFLKGIPLALKNINDLFEEYELHLELPELRRILKVCANEFNS